MKILAPDWLSKPFLNLVGSPPVPSFLCPTTSSCFKSFEFAFLRQVACAKKQGKSSAIARKKFLKVSFHVSKETARDYLSQKFKS